MNIKNLNTETIKYKLHHLTKKEKAKIILCLIACILIINEIEITILNLIVNLILLGLVIIIQYNLNELRNIRELYEEDLNYDYKYYEFNPLFGKNEMSINDKLNYLQTKQSNAPLSYILVSFVLFWLILFLTSNYSISFIVVLMMLVSLFYWGYVLARRDNWKYSRYDEGSNRIKKDWSYDYLIACPHCGYPRNRNKDTHCFKCKQKLRFEKGDKLVKVDFCPKCETIMEKDACPYCGYSATKLITKADIYWVLGIVLILGFLGLCAYIFPHHFIVRFSV